jgi:hypothetical protein
MCARVTGHQGRLFDTEGPAASELRCERCTRYLERTPSGFRACPRGHGKLIREAEDDPQPEDDDERWGRWFGAEGPESPGAASA